MKKVLRAIIEVDDPNYEGTGERELVQTLRDELRGWKSLRIKSFNAVMARERKKGLTEKQRFEAGRQRHLRKTLRKTRGKRGKTRGIDRYV